MEASARGHSLSDVARWMCERPAELAGLTERKGTLAAGRDADIVVFCPDETFEVQGSMLRHRHPSTTPWIGRRLRGVVKRTLVRGRVTYDDGALVNGGFGIWLT